MDRRFTPLRAADGIGFLRKSSRTPGLIEKRGAICNLIISLIEKYAVYYSILYFQI